MGITVDKFKELENEWVLIPSGTLWMGSPETES